MTEHRKPVLRIALPSSAHVMADKKYRIKEFVDRERPGRKTSTRLVLDFDIYRLLIDDVRTTIENKSDADLSADPGMIIEIALPLLKNEELLGLHVYEATSSAPTDPAEWKLIRETFAWRLLGRYNRELLEKVDDEDGDDERDGDGD